MNTKMTFHNIRVAWRNLMKYKAQNVIAVLCLAVGLVCFSMSFIITQRAWEYWKRDNGDPRRVRVELYTQSDSLISACPDEIQRIADSHLPSIEFIDIDYAAVGKPVDFTDSKGKKHEQHAHRSRQQRQLPRLSHHNDGSG